MRLVRSVGPEVASARSTVMSKTVEDLQREMEAAARALDFETAGRIRDRINLMRGGAKGGSLRPDPPAARCHGAGHEPAKADPSRRLEEAAKARPHDLRSKTQMSIGTAHGAIGQAARLSPLLRLLDLRCGCGLR